jgi:hypothetical protein
MLVRDLQVLADPLVGAGAPHHALLRLQLLKGHSFLLGRRDHADPPRALAHHRYGPFRRDGPRLRLGRRPRPARPLRPGCSARACQPPATALSPRTMLLSGPSRGGHEAGDVRSAARIGTGRRLAPGPRSSGGSRRASGAPARAPRGPGALAGDKRRLVRGPSRFPATAAQGLFRGGRRVGAHAPKSVSRGGPASEPQRRPDGRKEIRRLFRRGQPGHGLVKSACPRRCAN